MMLLAGAVLARLLLAWCVAEEVDEPDEYSTPDGMTDEERDLLEKEVNLARSKAMRAAQAAGKGPNSVEMAGHKAAIGARDAAHDRYHARLLAEGKAEPTGHAEKVPVLARKKEVAR